MTHIEWIDLYQSKLRQLQPSIRPQQDTVGRCSLAHLYWMLDEMKGMIVHDADGDAGLQSILKFNRWSGFVQGALWIEEGFSIDEMREHNRGLMYDG